MPMKTALCSTTETSKIFREPKMKAVKDIDRWLEDNAPTTPDALYSLYRAVTDRCRMGDYDAFESGGYLFVKAIQSPPLAPLQFKNEAAKRLFLIQVDKLRVRV